MLQRVLPPFLLPPIPIGSLSILNLPPPSCDPEFAWILLLFVVEILCRHLVRWDLLRLDRRLSWSPWV